MRSLPVRTLLIAFVLWDFGSSKHTVCGQEPDRLDSLYAPPAVYRNQWGNYRSPLLCADGSRIQSAAEWPRRRAEILEQWQEMMGPWPALLEQPSMVVLETSNREEYTQHHVRLQTGLQQEQLAWLLVPKGEGPFPAVIVVFYEPETSIGLKQDRPLRDFALQLTRRGFVTLSLGTPGGNAWQPDVANAQCQPLSYHAYVAANAWKALSQWPNVDSQRIGVTGHSYGGKWALFAAALWEPFACCAVSDPGIVFDEKRSNVNYWEPWYLGFDPQITRPRGIPSEERPRTGAYRVMIEKGHDLHEIHALLAPRPFLVSGGAEDPIERWVALNHLQQVNELLGFPRRVAMTSRPTHDPTPESNEALYSFFVHHLGKRP